MQSFWNKVCKFTTGILYCGLLMASNRAVSQSEHVHYWIRWTPEGTSETCRSADDYSEMVEVLREVGWPMDEVPLVDWEENGVTISAQDEFFKDHWITFDGLAWNDTTAKYDLTYRFVKRPPSVIIETSGAGGGVATSGSERGSTYETIVVERPHSMAGNVYCQWYYP